MGVITLDDGRSFTVNDSFGKLPADKQQEIVGELKKQLTGSVAKQIASGDTPVKTTLQTAGENFIPSAKNLAVGTLETIYEAGKTAINPDPRAKVEFIKNIGQGIYDRLKQYYNEGPEGVFARDPAGFIADVLSVAGGLRGVRAGRGVEVPTRSATRAKAIVDKDFISDTGQPLHQGVINATKTGSGITPGQNDLNTPMDRGGTAVANQVERLSNTSAGGREIIEPFLTNRQKGQFGRITEDLKTLTGSSRTAREALDQTMVAQQRAATPAYNAAYQAGDKIIWSPEIERLTGAPEVQQAMKSAITGWQRNQIAQGYGAARPGAIVAGTETNGTILSHPEMGGKMLQIVGGRVPVMPNIQFWDYTKAALDSMIDGEFRPDGRMTRKGRDLLTIKNKLTDELDKQVPEYAAARKTWSGPASYMNALEMGKSIFSEPSENFIPDFRKLSEADKQAVRESAVSKIVADLGKSSTNIGTDLRDLTAKLKSREMVQKVLAILPDHKSRVAWGQKLKGEVRSSELVGRGLKNSATARRLAQAAEAQGLIGDMVLGFIKGDVIASGGLTAKARLIARGWSAVRNKIQASTDREVAKILTGQKTSTKIQKPVGNRAALLLPAVTSQQQ